MSDTFTELHGGPGLPRPTGSPSPEVIEFGAERSLSDLILAYEATGHTHNLMAMIGGRIRCTTCGFEGPASAGHIEAFQRFEGSSDPEEMSIVAALVRTRPDGADCRGVLVLAFGPTASPEDKDVFAALQFDTRSRTLHPEPAAHPGQPSASA